MCGIVACHGVDPALPALLAGLARLEYRGYDSTGVALNHGTGDPPRIYRAEGRLPNLTAQLPDDQPSERIGIAHTRWATHGRPSQDNAHPHRDSTGRVAVVHNGTLENAPALRAELVAAGHVIATEVDTELIAHLIAAELAATTGDSTREAVTAAAAHDVVAAVAAVTARLEGSWALAVTVQGVDGVVLARHHSPLLVGEAAGLRMAASDQLGFDPRIAAARELAEDDIVVLAEEITWFDANANPIPPRPKWTITHQRATELAGAADFTAKEIDEQAKTAQDLVNDLVGGLRGGRLLTGLGLPARSRVRLVACGTSAYAARVIAHTLAAAGIPAQIITASEHTDVVAEPDTLTVAISQSGETADVLSALDAFTDPLLALTNQPQSTLARRADAVLELRCGPEIGVAATKSFTAQVIAGSALALSLGSALGRLGDAELAGDEDLLSGIPDRLSTTDRQVAGPAADLAAALAEQPGWVFASRGAGVPYALEGALKLKELAYRWTEALPAGELKHGPIALIQPGTPVVLVQAEPLARLAVNARELAARGGRIITVGPDEDAALRTATPSRQPPWGPLESVVALQHLARETAHHLGCDIDRPRNLAKSVTVE